MENLGGFASLLKDFHSIIWKDAYPKKIKIFFWELYHGAINTQGRCRSFTMPNAIFPLISHLEYHVQEKITLTHSQIST